MHARILQNRQKEFANLAFLPLPCAPPPFSPSLLPLPFSIPCPEGLHYDGMHNARWVCRRAVCASYIAMADGRDSKKDFPNRISSPRTAYIFHDRGRANRLPLLSSIFCAPRDISSRVSRIDVDEWNVSRSLSRGSWKLVLENQNGGCLF